MQSDERFTEIYVRTRIGKGYGPIWISRSLRIEKGISDILINQYVQEQDTQWITLARATRYKKYGSETPKNYKQKTQEARFLQSRGFNNEQIHQSYKIEE